MSFKHSGAKALFKTTARGCLPFCQINSTLLSFAKKRRINLTKKGDIEFLKLTSVLWCVKTVHPSSRRGAMALAFCSFSRKDHFLHKPEDLISAVLAETAERAPLATYIKYVTGH
jgi:hypothetical protein